MKLLLITPFVLLLSCSSEVSDMKNYDDLRGLDIRAVEKKLGSPLNTNIKYISIDSKDAANKVVYTLEYEDVIFTFNYKEEMLQMQRK